MIMNCHLALSKKDVLMKLVHSNSAPDNFSRVAKIRFFVSAVLILVMGNILLIYAVAMELRTFFSYRLVQRIP